ncbi:hypothetical protein ZIOFF_016029 [Zingiber officinale]|uniref:Uncharacterized protein n=1 Tax=Zingiber officinale TaxID=94328 RepID=A0A8J5HVC8_ZINOF|nr:hypothetical protein ZIOFF_016029 [Zingiber officinale]
MKIANNKLVDPPSCLSSMADLEMLDLSNNRLTSLSSLRLSSMHALQLLNLQTYLNHLREEGQKHVPADIALCIADFLRTSA